MADDASYTAFLSKANQDPNANTNASTSTHYSTAQAKSKLDPTTPSISSVPPALQNIDAYYTSDTDAPFEPIMYAYSGSGLPSAEEFAKCIGVEETRVEKLEEKEFDPRGQYGEVIEMVKRAAGEKGTADRVRVFNVSFDQRRSRYYIVGVGDRKLVGVMAESVES